MHVLARPTRPKTCPKTRTNWDDLRIFMTLVDTGSFRRAADELKMSINSIRLRMDKLEHDYNTLLVKRSATGVKLTEAGRRVYSISVDMFYQYNALNRVKSLGTFSRPVDTVRIGVTEGLGTFWLLRRAVDVTKSNPDLRLDLRCEMRVHDISQLEVDIAVQLDKPANEDLIISRLGYLHFMFFSSNEYVVRHQEPWSAQDIAHHDFVLLDGGQTVTVERLAAQQINDSPEGQAVRIAQCLQPENITVRANTSTAHAQAILHGAGIGALPTYVRVLTRKLRPVLHNCHIRRDIWLVIRPDIRNEDRVQRAVTWLKAAFNATDFPWFGPEFLHPADIDRILEERGPNQNFPSLFDNMATQAK